MAGAQPSFSGNCFYSGGTVFQAQLFGKVYDREQGRSTNMRYHCNDPLVLDVLRQCFELLVSSNAQIQIGDRIITRDSLPGSNLPIVTVEIGRTIYQMTQSKNGSGAARLEVFLPFAVEGGEIDLRELVQDEEEGD